MKPRNVAARCATQSGGQASRNSISRWSAVAAASCWPRGEAANRSIIALANRGRFVGMMNDMQWGQMFAPSGDFGVDGRAVKSMRARTSWTSKPRPRASSKGSAAGDTAGRASSGTRPAVAPCAATSWPVRRENENCRRAARVDRDRADVGRNRCRRRRPPGRALLPACGADRGRANRPMGLWSSRGGGAMWTRGCFVAGRQFAEEIAGFQIEMVGDEFHPIAFGFVERFEAAGEEQVVGGPRAGDVQQALAFFEFGGALAGGEERHAGGRFLRRSSLGMRTSGPSRRRARLGGVSSAAGDRGRARRRTGTRVPWHGGSSSGG